MTTSSGLGPTMAPGAASVATPGVALTGGRTAAQTWRRAGLIVVVLIALVVRVAVVAGTQGLALTNDPADYDHIARSIANGHGYPTARIGPVGRASAFRPPGYPLFLAGVYKVTGDSLTAGRLAQALLGAAAVALIALIALELWGPAVALVAGLLAAVFPPLIIDGMTLLSEPLFVTCMLGAIFGVLRWRRSGHIPWLVAAGFCTGLAILTRQNGELLLLPLLFAARRAGAWRRPRTYAAPALLLASTVCLVLPWTIRNAVELHAFVPVSDQDGYTLAGTYNATSRSQNAQWLVASKDPAMAAVIGRYRGDGELALDNRLRGEARRFALAHPGYLFEVALHNTLRLFNLGGSTFERQATRAAYNLGSNWARLMTFGLFPFLLLAIAGLFTRAVRRGPRWFWVIPILMWLPIMVLATNRIRAPIDPFLLILGALALTELLPRVIRRRPASA